MSKKKNAAVKPEGKIKHMLRTNYWLTPLLLVSLVFALVFGISKIPDLSKTVQGWFTKHETCDECTNITFDEFKNKKAENGTFYLVVGADDCTTCEDFYPVLDKFLKTNKGPHKLDVVYIDVTVDEDEKYKDDTLTTAKLSELKDDIRAYNDSELVYPSIIKYTDKIIVDIASNTQTYDQLMEFFNINK